MPLTSTDMRRHCIRLQTGLFRLLQLYPDIVLVTQSIRSVDPVVARVQSTIRLFLTTYNTALGSGTVMHFEVK